MKIDTSTILNVLIALAVFKVVDKVFLDKALSKIGNFDSVDPDTI